MKRFFLSLFGSFFSNPIKRPRGAESSLDRRDNSDPNIANDWLRSHNSYHRRPNVPTSNQKPIWERIIDEDAERRSISETGYSITEAKKIEERSELRKQLQLEKEISESALLGDLISEKAATEGSKWPGERIRPGKHIYGVSDSGAEQLVGDWMRYLGESEVVVTKQSGDGGVDVLTSRLCCQVKNYKRQPVTASEVRDLLGTSYSFGKSPVLFTSSTLTADAADFCVRNEIAVINYNAENAQLAALNTFGLRLLKAGLYEDPSDQV